jgi:hypothetical protein
LDPPEITCSKRFSRMLASRKEFDIYLYFNPSFPKTRMNTRNIGKIRLAGNS